MSEGLKEALEYAVGISEPHFQDVDGERYADKTMFRVRDPQPKAEPVKMTTLTSLIDYIRSETDEMLGNMVIHVKSPTEVALYSQLDRDRVREELVTVKAQTPEFAFGKYYDQESFIINVQAKFIGSKTPLPIQDDYGENVRVQYDLNDKENVLKFIGTMQTGTLANYGDDGISQKATIQNTVTSKSDAIVPNPVTLVPFRTFLEVEQPASEFVFRVRQDPGGGPSAALFEADGGYWKIVAMRNIQVFLEDALKEMSDLSEKFVVIS